MKSPFRDNMSIKIRLMSGNDIAMGPGKADLLEAIEKTGSISAAAREMKMSYRRSWQLVDTMNACFKKPLVEKIKGGHQRGGATLTPTGSEVLRQYRDIQEKAEKSARKDMQKLSRQLVS